MRPHRCPSLPILLIATALLTTGCGKSSDTDSSTDNNAAQQEEQSAQSADTAEPALPKVDYWKPVLAAMQGEYRDQCAEGLERKPFTDTIKIGADGTVSVGGVNFHPRDGKTTLMRTPPASGKAENVSLIHDAGEVALTLNNFGPGANDHVTVNYGGKGVACSNVKDVLRLDGRTLLTTFAQQFTVKPRRIACIVMPELMSTKQVDFVLEGKQLKVGEQVFDLDKVAAETVNFENDTASYSISTEPQRLAVVIFDAYGRLSNVTVNGFDSGPSYACANLEQKTD